MASPVTDRLANDVIRHKTGALSALIAHARALEEAQDPAKRELVWVMAERDAAVARADELAEAIEVHRHAVHQHGERVGFGMADDHDRQLWSALADLGTDR